MGSLLLLVLLAPGIAAAIVAARRGVLEARLVALALLVGVLTGRAVIGIAAFDELGWRVVPLVLTPWRGGISYLGLLGGSSAALCALTFVAVRRRARR